MSHASKCYVGDHSHPRQHLEFALVKYAAEPNFYNERQRAVLDILAPQNINKTNSTRQNPGRRGGYASTPKSGQTSVSKLIVKDSSASATTSAAISSESTAHEIRRTTPIIPARAQPEPNYGCPVLKAHPEFGVLGCSYHRKSNCCAMSHASKCYVCDHSHPRQHLQYTLVNYAEDSGFYGEKQRSILDSLVKK